MSNGPIWLCADCGRESPSWASRCACGSTALRRQLVIGEVEDAGLMERGVVEIVPGRKGKAASGEQPLESAAVARDEPIAPEVTAA